ncbi:MAG TPA: lipase secretion chaperone [Noviherbaspirillum sp.]
MEIRKTALWAGAAIAAVSAVMLLSSGHDEHTPVQLAGGHDMFSFIQPMAQVAAAPAEQAAQPLQPQAQAQARARQSRQPQDNDAAAGAAVVEQEIRLLRSQGASEDEVYRLRAQRLSPETAERLAQLERDESQWQARIELYLAERARLLSLDAGAQGAAPTETLQQLRNAFFSAEEQERLAAYEPQATPQLTMH